MTPRGTQNRTSLMPYRVTPEEIRQAYLSRLLPHVDPDWLNKLDGILAQLSSHLGQPPLGLQQKTIQSESLGIEVRYSPRSWLPEELCLRFTLHT